EGEFKQTSSFLV
nr:Chain B, Junctional adhesion molecule A [Homo sapiens]